MSEKRVYVTKATTGKASCFLCRGTFAKGDTKIAICTLSRWHSGHDDNMHHLSCASARIEKFCRVNHKLPEFYHRLSGQELRQLNECIGASASTVALLNVENEDLQCKMDLQFHELIDALLTALGPKDLKDFLTVNSKDFDEQFKGPQLAHHAADLLYYGQQTHACPACSKKVAVGCPALNTAFCDGNIEGFGSCSYKWNCAKLERGPCLLTKAVVKKMKMDAANNYNIAGKPEHANPSIKPVLLAPASQQVTAAMTGKRAANKTLMKGSSSVLSPSASATRKEEQKSKRRKITDKQKKVDPESGMQGHIYVDEVKGVVYSCTMNMIGEGFSKYYVLQLIRNTRGSQTYFTLFRKWGKTGQSWSRDSMHEDYISISDATAEFVKQFEIKTRNKFENVLHGFVKKANAYNLVDQYEDDDDTNLKLVLEAARELAQKQPEESSGSGNGGSGNGKEEAAVVAVKALLSAATTTTHRMKSIKLTKAVKDLVATIFDAKEIAKTMANVGLNSNKMPLGELSKTSIKEGYLTLSKIADLLKVLSGNGDKQAPTIQLKAAIQKFYTIIPCASTFQTPIDANTLPVKIKFLDELMNIEACKEMVGGSEQSVEEQYLKLGVQLAAIPKKTVEFKTIQKAVKLTQSAGMGYTVEVSKVFTVTDTQRNVAYDEYSRDLGNRRLLWHGSRTSNFSGILSQGLRIAPPEAPVSGYLFGKGVYFANSVSKSIMYCNPEIENGVGMGLVILCEVALGTPLQLQSPDSSIKKETLPEGAASTHGVGMMTPNSDSFTTLPTLGKEVIMSSGKLEVNLSSTTRSHLHFDEFIVYDTRQQTPRFLVELKILHGK